MGITVYSLAISIVYYNLALFAVLILRRSSVFRARYTVSLLLFITLLGAIRLLVPIDFDAYVLRSYKLIPAIEDFLRRPLIGTLTLGKLLLLVWFLGGAVTLINKLRVQWAFDRGLRSFDFVDRPRILEIAAEYGSNFAVLISPQLRSSYTSGLLRPVIYLPDLELSDDEWRMVLLHEITHILSQDNWKKLFFLAIETIFWWNPLAHFSGEEISTLIELHCDTKVTAKMDERECYEYASLLRKLMDCYDPRKTPAPASPLVGAEEQMNQRITALVYPRDRKHSLYIVFALLILAFVLSYSVVVQPARMLTANWLVDETDETVSVISIFDIPTGNLLSDSQIIFENGRYHLYNNGVFVGSVYEEELSGIPDNILPIIGGK